MSNNFQLIPAIDLMDGACVRLQQGDASRKTRYSIAPAEIARQYAAAGVNRIHVVDLDGAFSGKPSNLAAIKSIRDAAPNAQIEVGGGIREASTVESLFEAGINFAVIGTKALEDPLFLQNMIAEHGEKIIVGADARDGNLSTRGWTSDTTVKAVPYLRKLREDMGLSTVIFTDIARDGMFTSPDLPSYKELLTIDGLQVIASGGVGSAEDVATLRSLNNQCLLGVIVGKALYDGRLNLHDAVVAARGTTSAR
jgi:phosphoribosylformimino-5-aminoimidazole carboxamide ribotide isomerase